MNIKIDEYQLPAKITFNFEEIKAELTTKLETYKHMVYTESDIKAAKADKAELNKLKKAVNDERIARQKEYMKPFDALKKQMDEIISLIDEPVRVIDEQVKAYEAKQKEEKERNVRELFGNINPYEWLTFDQVFDSKWLNASTSMSTVEEQMKLNFATIETNLNTLKGLEYEFEATERFKETLSLSSAVTENKRLSDLAKRKAELEAAKEAAKEAIKEEPKEEPKAEIKEEPKEEPMPMEEPGEAAEEEKEWMELQVKINTSEYTALVDWLKASGIEWRIV